MNLVRAARFAAVACAVLGSASTAGHGIAQVDWDREVGAALESADRSDLADCHAVAIRLLAENPQDWRAWYLRFLSIPHRDLEPAEKERIEGLQPPDYRETVRGLWGYLTSIKSARLPLARDLVERHPDSALARTLLASSLLSSGEPHEALAEAAHVLDSSTPNFLAARVEMAALEHLGESERLASRACAVLREFPHDPFLMQRGFEHCPPDPDAGRRLAQYRPILVARAGTPAATFALGRVLTGGDQPVPGSAIRELLPLLDASDRGWWVHAPLLLSRLDADLGSVGQGENDFLRALLEVASVAGDPVADTIVERASSSLAQVSRRAGRYAEAEAVLRNTLALLPRLDRGAHYEALAELALDMNRKADWRTYSARALFLARPFEERFLESGDQAGERNRDVWGMAQELLQKLNSFELEDAAGRVVAMQPEHERPRLLVFWTADCFWFRKEAERLMGFLRQEDHPLVTRHVEVLWIHRGPKTERRDALAVAQELGLDLDRVFFLPETAAPGIETTLRTTGSPCLFLILPGGWVALELDGYHKQDWTPSVDRILAAFERAQSSAPGS